MRAEPTARWPAPAKLNLFLQVVGHRADGYHLLQTVFQLLDWGDEIALAARADGQIVLHSVTPGVEPDSDLAVRAARLLQQATGARQGADIDVVKRIPMGGGFGGGSSDAATVLCVLNRLWGCGLDEDRLAALGLQLGADVPLFVRGRSAWAEGVGERLTPMTLPERWFVLIDAGVRLATAELFQAPELTRNASPLTMADFALDRVGENAFAVPARARSATLVVLLDALQQRGAAGLTGSGGGCFVMLGSRQDAEAVAAQLGGYGRCVVARGVNRSPLHDRLEGWRQRADVHEG